MEETTQAESVMWGEKKDHDAVCLGVGRKSRSWQKTEEDLLVKQEDSQAPTLSQNPNDGVLKGRRNQLCWESK